MRACLIAAGSVLLAGSAAAQQSPRDALARLGIKMVEPMSAKELAATKARVDAQLSKSGAAASFDNISDANGGKVRHRPSGLVCSLGENGQSVEAGPADGATCRGKDGNALYEMKVVRAPAGATLTSVAHAALADARTEPGFKPSGGLSVSGHPQEGSGRPDHETFRFTSRVDGRERASRLQVGIVRGWVLTDRSMTPKSAAQPSMMSTLLEESSFGSNMNQ